MYSLGRGYEPIDSPYSTPYGAMVLPRIAHRNPVSYYRMLWTAARYSLSLFQHPTRWDALPVSPSSPYLFLAPVYPWKAPPCRRAQCEWPRPLCHRLYASIDTYLPIRAGAMLPISTDKCAQRVGCIRCAPLSHRWNSSESTRIHNFDSRLSSLWMLFWSRSYNPGYQVVQNGWTERSLYLRLF